MSSALLVHVRVGALSRRDARARLRLALELPLEIVPLHTLADAAFGLAVRLGLSAYDACYAALAEASDAVLVTADVDLAAAIGRSALLPGTPPPGQLERP